MAALQHGVPRQMSWQKYLRLAVKSGNNKIIYQDILTALADEANDLLAPCHEQRTGAATVHNALHHSAELVYFPFKGRV